MGPLARRECLRHPLWSEEPNPSISYAYTVSEPPSGVLDRYIPVLGDGLSQRCRGDAISPASRRQALCSQASERSRPLTAGYRANIMLAGMKSWKIVLSSDGRKALRIRPVPFAVGLLSPSLARVSVVRVVSLVKVYGPSRTRLSPL